MKILLLTNPLCHCVDVGRELEALGLRYTQCNVDEHPNIAQRYGVRHLPTLIIDEKTIIPIDESNIHRLMHLLTAI